MVLVLGAWEPFRKQPTNISTGVRANVYTSYLVLSTKSVN